MKEKKHEVFIEPHTYTPINSIVQKVDAFSARHAI